MKTTSRIKILAAVVNAVSIVAAAGIFLLLLQLTSPPDIAATTADRLAFAARLIAWPAMLLLVMVAATSGSRVLGNLYDPIADGETRLYRVSQKVLTNSVEQIAVFAPLMLAAATVVPADRLGVLTAATMLYVLGRVVFWIGYLIHPYARAPGMVMTAAPSAGLAVYLVLTALV